MYHNALAWILSIAGLVPVALACLWGYYHPLEGPLVAAILQYLAIIQAFLAGTSWAFSLRSAEHGWGLVYAVGFALLPWFASVLSVTSRLALACVGFLGLLGFDYLLHNKQIISGWYFTLRLLITSIMTALLLIMMALL